MKPIVHGLEARYYGRIRFIYLDVDDPKTAGLKSTLGYRVQPHFFLLNGNGEVIRQWVGKVDGAEFVKAFESILK